MAQIVELIYNENEELLETKIHEIEGPTQEEVIAQKEAQLLAMYQELKVLKGE